MIKNKRFSALILSVLMISSLMTVQPAYGVTNNFIAASGGTQSTLALNSDGSVWGWGLNQYGQIGDGTSASRPYRVKVVGLSEVKAIAAGSMHSVAVKNDGTVFAWGLNSSGTLGDGTLVNRYLPIQVTGLTDVKAVTAGSSHSVALKNDGTVWVWGNDWTKPTDLQTSFLGYDLIVKPVQVKGLINVQGIATGPTSYLIFTADGTMLSWGANQGILGDGTGITRTTPSPVVDSLLPNNMRLAGYDLIDTSIAISQKSFPVNHSTNAVLLATGYNFPDALAGASLGVSENAPLLLVDPKGDNQKTIEEIKRVLMPEGKIYILGGTAVVPSTLEAELKDKPFYHFTVQRLAGVTAYGTAAEIAKQVKPSGGGEVIIATGE
ncbi:MAG: putative cell wall binding protein, partial [Firmicutes bacterium]|nr:putative cell wall binding protein [Bacillota bacterium]